MTHDTILVINCGSSSLKFALYSADDMSCHASGLAECLGTAKAQLNFNAHEKSIPVELGQCNHHNAIVRVIEELKTAGLLNKPPIGIGHRVVHGGESFSNSTLIDDQVINKINQCSDLAPLHNPANLLGIKLMMEFYPSAVQVAVFDTAFHQTLEETSYLYPIPYELYQKYGVRRYGFHGTSHKFVAEEAAKKLNKPLKSCHFITAHLGNGCSVTAIKNGQSVDTSMGLTPLEGLMMGTRSGDIDPGLFEFLGGIGMDNKAISHMLNKESGLKGLSGKTNDMRTLFELAEKGNERANIAINVFCFKLAKYIASMCASLPSLDALIFTGGIGENASKVREYTLDRLIILGFQINNDLNTAHGKNSQGRITNDESTLALVIPTNEELVIARDTLANTKH